MKTVRLILPEDMKSLTKAIVELAAILSDKPYDFVKSFLQEVIIKDSISDDR